MRYFLRESRVGPRGSHNPEGKGQLLDFKRGENNEKVKRWIDGGLVLGKQGGAGNQR
jgi:hypothetical protein